MCVFDVTWFGSCSLAVRRPSTRAVSQKLHGNVLRDRTEQVSFAVCCFREVRHQCVCSGLMLMSVCLSGTNPASCTLTSSNVPRRQTSWLQLCRVSSVPPHRYHIFVQTLTMLTRFLHQNSTNIEQFSVLFLTLWFELYIIGVCFL